MYIKKVLIKENKKNLLLKYYHFIIHQIIKKNLEYLIVEEKYEKIHNKKNMYMLEEDFIHNYM